MAENIGGRRGPFFGEPMVFQGVLAVGRFLEVRDEQHVGGDGGLAFTVFQEIAGVLKDLAAGRCVVGQMAGSLERKIKGRITRVAFGADGMRDMSFQPCTDSPDFILSRCDQDVPIRKLIGALLVLAQEGEEAVVKVPIAVGFVERAVGRPAKAEGCVENGFADLTDKE